MSNCFRAWGGLQKRRAGSKYAFFWPFGLFDLLAVFHVKDGGVDLVKSVGAKNLKLMLLMMSMTVRMWGCYSHGFVVLYLFVFLFCIRKTFPAAKNSWFSCCFVFSFFCFVLVGFVVLYLLALLFCISKSFPIYSVDTLFPSLFPLFKYLLCCFVFVFVV